MKIWRGLCVGSTVTLVTVLGAACGSESDNPAKTTTEQNPDASGGPDGSNGRGEADDGSEGLDGSHASADATADDGGVILLDGSISEGGPGPILNCAAATSQGPVPVNLVVMFDSSASLGDGPNGNNRATRWTPVTTAMKDFFSAPQAAGMRAQLEYFPILMGDGTAVCQTSAYASPVVPLTALPTASFGASINAKAPNGSSPMYPAMNGAVAAAKTSASRYPGQKTAIVLVTDGVPSDCVSTVDNVREVTAAAYAGSPSIPTYVVAVGPDTVALNALAAAGGTQSAVVVSPDDPAKASRDLLAKLSDLRIASCDPLTLPAVGVPIDLNGTRVTLSTASGSATVPNDPSCAGQGWYYDNPAAPKKVELCAATCQSLRSDNQAKVTVAINCQASDGGGPSDGGTGPIH